MQKAKTEIGAQGSLIDDLKQLLEASDKSDELQKLL